MELILRDIHFPMRHPFTIALGATTVQHHLLVELRQDGVSGVRLEKGRAIFPDESGNGVKLL